MEASKLKKFINAFFKIKKKGNTNFIGLENKESPWWKGLENLFQKDTGGVIDHSDPEYDAQKIYMHWINSFI